jgi:hypothetical protein
MLAVILIIALTEKYPNKEFVIKVQPAGMIDGAGNVRGLMELGITIKETELESLGGEFISIFRVVKKLSDDEIARLEGAETVKRRARRSRL